MLIDFKQLDPQASLYKIIKTRYKITGLIFMVCIIKYLTQYEYLCELFLILN